MYVIRIVRCISWTGLADRLEGWRVRVCTKGDSPENDGADTCRPSPPSRSPSSERHRGVGNITTSLFLSFPLQPWVYPSAAAPELRSNICPRKNKSLLSLTTGRASLVSKRALFNRRRITDPEPSPFKAPFSLCPISLLLSLCSLPSILDLSQPSSSCSRSFF